LSEECIENKILFYDVSNFLNNYCIKNNINISETYEDFSHPFEEIACLIGQDFSLYLQENLNQANTKNDNLRSSSFEKDKYLDNFEYFDFEKTKSKNIDIREIKNSLVDFKSMFLKSENEELEIKLNHGLWVPIGFFYNESSSRGSFAIEGLNKIKKSVNSNYYSIDGKLVWARPIHSLVQADNNNLLKIRGDFEKNSNVIELTEHVKNPTNDELKNSTLDLISIICVDLPRLLGDDLALYLLNKTINLQTNLLAKLNFIKDLYSHDWKVLNTIKTGNYNNVALNCNASQSSFYSADKKNPSLACNGSKNGYFSFHTELEEYPWWSVDLGKLLKIKAIVIYNRTDVARERVKFLRVFISDNQIDWVGVYSHNGRPPFGGVDTDYLIPPLTLELENVNARYIKIDIAERNYLHLDEVEVYCEF